MSEESRKRVKRESSPLITDRLPPHAIEAEQALLGAIFLDPVYVFTELGEKQVEKYFYDLRHQIIYEAMRVLYDHQKPVELIAVMDVLRSNNQLEPCGGIPYLNALPDCVPTAANAKYHLEILEEKYALRSVINTCTKTIADAYEAEKASPQLVIDSVSRTFTDLAVEFSGQKISNIKDLVHACIEDYEKQAKQESTQWGIMTGFVDYDKMTGGLKPGEYVVIAARPSLGKTSLSMNIVENVAIDQKMPVGVFSLEMTAKSLVDRMITSRARVNRQNIRDGFLADRDYPKLTGSAGKIAHAPIYIDDTPELNILQIRARSKKMAQEYGIRLIVIDYLQLVKSMSTRYETRDTEISRISAGIKALLKELNIPGLIIGQLNRDIEREKNRKPRLSDLRESGSIEQDADTIGMLYQPKEGDEEENENPGAVPINLYIRKQRSGPTGEIHLTFLKSFTRFESAAKVQDVPA